jgi:hypothetical protein
MDNVHATGAAHQLGIALSNEMAAVTGLQYSRRMAIFPSRSSKRKTYRLS